MGRRHRCQSTKLDIISKELVLHMPLCIPLHIFSHWPNELSNLHLWDDCRLDLQCKQQLFMCCGWRANFSHHSALHIPDIHWWHPRFNSHPLWPKYWVCLPGQFQVPFSQDCSNLSWEILLVDPLQPRLQPYWAGLWYAGKNDGWNWCPYPQHIKNCWSNWLSPPTWRFESSLGQWENV